MFFKDCTMDAINEIASAELQKLATADKVNVKDLNSQEAIAIRNKRDKNLDDVEKFQLRKTNGYWIPHCVRWKHLGLRSQRALALVHCHASL
jgi:hypothetical protein